MLRRQKRAAIVATAAALTTLTACQGFAGDTDTDAINILLVDQPTTKNMREVWIPKFEDQTGIDINTELVPEAGMDAKLATSLSGDAQYDVVMTGARNWTTLVASDWIDPVNDLLQNPDRTPRQYTAGFSRQLLKNISVDGEQYAMPFQVGGNMLFYNKKLFAQAGLEPNDPPHTMREIITTARVFEKADTGSAAFVGRGTRKGEENSFLWLMMWFLNGGRWGDPADAEYADVLTQPAAQRATRQYAELMGELSPPGASNYGFAEAQLAMQQGQAAMWIDAAQLGPALEDTSKSMIAGNVGYAALAGSGDDYIAGAVWGLSLVSGSDRKKDAWKLITYLTGKKVSVAQTVSGVNGSPARSDVLSAPAVKSALNPDFLDALKKTIPHANPNYTPLIAEGTQIRGAISLALSKLLSGSETPTSAMESASDEVADIMGGG